jgi:LysM domain
MGSLTAHLLEAGDHGRLRFHPSCPVCRQERLHGTLSSEPVVPRRAQALLAGGVLAISSAGPAVALAQEPDRQFEGIAAPEDPGAPDLDDPGFDPGGGDTPLSFDTAPAPTAPEDGVDSGEGPPLDGEPTVDLDARLAPLETDTSVGEEESAVPPAETVSPDTAVPPSAAPGGAVPPGTSAQPGGPNPSGPVAPPEGDALPGQPPAQAGLVRAHRPRTHLPTRARSTYTQGRSDAGAPASSQRVSDGAGAPPEPVVAPVREYAATDDTGASMEPAARGTTGVSTQTTAKDPPLDGDARVYVVRPGDSLWSIAKQLLGRDASAGLIAREVNRLWSLNRSAIATGDPDLLMVGTRLELR